MSKIPDDSLELTKNKTKKADGAGAVKELVL